MADVASPQRQHSGFGSFGQSGQQQNPPHVDPSEIGSDAAGADKGQDAEKELAIRLARIIEDANKRVIPLVNMIRQNIEHFQDTKEEDRNEDELIKAVKPLIEQAEKVLYEANGAIKGADPEGKLSDRATRNYQDHTATPEEQRLAQAIKVLVEEVGGTIDWAKNKLNSFPKAKRDLGPLLDALGQPLTQIVGGVGLLLNGVLSLVGKLLSGLGLDSVLKGIFTAAGLDKIYKGIGLDKMLG
ncbi:hypothetical protein PENSPDRAFT_667585 [Peniophora sp. CONT]|nr:hypothetical protein PENSPDRAFT_667585 [Peniophora sp. CONT]